MPVRRLTDETIERAAAMRERGLPIMRIASAVGCSHGALAWHFLKLGVEPPKPGRLQPGRHRLHPITKRGNHVVRAFTPQEDRRLLELEARGVKLSAIARELGRRHNSIKGRLMTLARYDERQLARAETEGVRS